MTFSMGELRHVTARPRKVAAGKSVYYGYQAIISACTVITGKITRARLTCLLL